MSRYYMFYFVVLGFFASLIAQDASAITIDEFNGSQVVQAQLGFPPNFSQLSDSQIISGSRCVEIAATSGGGGNVLVETFNGIFSHSQTSNIAGYSLLSWDGDTNPQLITPSGLGGIDFTQDGATAIEIDAVFFDYPNLKPITLVATVFDSLFPTNFSVGSITLNAAIPNAPGTLLIPFGNFVAGQGSTGPADFHRVGAVTLKVASEAAPAADLQLEWVGTNGLCRLIPDQNGRVIDQCGVCGGNGTSCLDCHGIPFGGAEIDQCNICGGDGTSCLDCTGTPFGTLTTDPCGVCGGDGSTCRTCVDIDLTPLSTSLDGGAKKLEAVIKDVVEKILKIKSDKKTKAWAKSFKAEVHRLQITNWIISWEFPRTLTQCSNVAYCSVRDYQSTADQYRFHNEELHQMGLTAVNRLKRLGSGAAKQAVRSKKSIEHEVKKNYDLSLTVPVVDASC